MKPTLATYHTKGQDIQTPFDIAVIIPTILRESLIDAVRSLYAQDFKGRVQIVIGLDRTDPKFDINALIAERPEHMAVTIFWPGYSTNAKHGGIHHVLGGGSLRSVLSFLANAKALTYLDDDNWCAPNHLSSLYEALKGQRWAYSNRWFIDEDTKQPLCRDTWESVGINQGIFAESFNGFVDTNCLMIDTLACAEHLSNWCLAQPDGNGADRNFFKALSKRVRAGQSKQATVNYVIQKKDINHQARLDYITEHNIPKGPEHYPDWPGLPAHLPKNKHRTVSSGSYQLFGDHNRPFDCSVVIPTIGRDGLKRAVQSIYQQDYKGRVQILIGLDKGTFPEKLDEGLPDHMGLVLFDPGYSTSTRHGGVFNAHDGGSLRTILSFLAHAPYVAYLDDDNRLRPHHLSSLIKAVEGHHYSYSKRMFIHPNGETVICPDNLESIGPNKGVYSYKLKGFIDPNCLMINVKACINALPLWTMPLANDAEKMSADRRVFLLLATRAKGRPTHQVSVDYVLHKQDPMHPIRTIYMGSFWQNAELAAFKRQLLAAAQKR